MTPLPQLNSPPASAPRGGSLIRTRILEEMLLCSGESGYSKVTVDLLCRRFEGQRGQFYRHFTSKASCFHAAYEMGIARLTGQLLSASNGPREGLPEALYALGRFLAAEPATAKALFVEVHAVGGRSLERRQAAFDDLAGALDARYRNQSFPAPEITAPFLLYAIDHIASDLLIAGRHDDFFGEIPGLVSLVEAAYGMAAPVTTV